MINWPNKPYINTMNTEENQQLTPVQEINNGLDLYEHGLTNGILKVQREHFESFIRETQLHKQTSAELESAQKSIEEKQNILQETQSEKRILRSRVVENKELLQVEQKQYERTNAETKSINALIFQDTDEKNKLNPPYSWIPAILYLLAGIVFISSDISITHDIVSWGLDMGGLEAWIFAVGLAALAFLIKPAVDRIVEKPYRTGQGIRTNHGVLIGLCVVAMITLGILGYFRGEADKLKNLKRNLTNEKTKILEKQSREPNAAERLRLGQEAAKIENQIADYQNKLTDNWARVTSFILSSILFAFAGAVCLGIAFPAIDILHRKQMILPKRIKKRQAQLQQQHDKLTLHEQQIAKYQTEIQQAEVALQLLPETKNILEEIQELEAAQEQALGDIHNHQIEAQRGLYADGYERGNVFKMDGQLSYSTADAENKVLKNTRLAEALKSTTAPAEKSKSPESQLRPYQMLRKYITNNFTENK